MGHIEDEETQSYLERPAWSDEADFERLCYPICERILSVYWDETKSTEAFFSIRYSAVSRSTREMRGDFLRVQLKEIGRVINSCGSQLFMPAGREARYRNLSNTVQVVVDTRLAKVRLGPIGNILLEGDLREHRLGRFLLTEVITWLKQNYPEFGIARGYLRYGDATDDNIERRDQFYRNAGLSIVYTHERSDGYFFADRIEDLTPYCPVNMRLIAPEILAVRTVLAEEANNKYQKQNTSVLKALDDNRRSLGKYLQQRDCLAGALSVVLILFAFFAYHNWQW